MHANARRCLKNITRQQLIQTFSDPAQAVEFQLQVN